MIIPRSIKKGDYIGVTAMSSGVTDPLDVVRFNNAKRKLLDYGYNVVETPNTYTSDNTGRSSSANQRVSELCSLIENNSISCIISAKGGNCQHEMLKLIDWDLIEKNPKWIQGYSDNTMLIFKMTVEHDISTVYGSNFGDFGMEPWHRSIIENLHILEGKTDTQRSFPYHEIKFYDRYTGLEGINEEEATIWKSNLDDAKFKGRLIGGCMDTLGWLYYNKMVDPYNFINKYLDDSFVWYMETYNMDELRVRSMLRGMSDSGWFDKVSGFIFGRPMFYSGEHYEDSICKELFRFDVPKIFDADIGHKAPRMTLINGVITSFRVADGKCNMRYMFHQS